MHVIAAKAPHFALFGLMLLLALGSRAKADELLDCANPMNQYTLNQCAGASFRGPRRR
jgi:hypothetical protein